AERSGVGHLVECDSAGTIDMHTGNPPDKRMRKTAEGRGIPIAGAARQIHADDLHGFDLIVTMDAENRAYVDRLMAKAGGSAELRNFCELCGDPQGHDEVPDPYYGGQEGFDLVLDLLEDGCGALLAEIRGRQS
ncbi:MAG: low molecular weight protein-tyrosine-phosphatase, partial [Verrucomicrobiales bacterium]